MYLSARNWVLPSGVNVSWTIKLGQPIELIDCYLVDNVLITKTRWVWMSRPASVNIREEVLADLERVDIENNWKTL
jgi:hypothetical protein